MRQLITILTAAVGLASLGCGSNGSSTETEADVGPAAEQRREILGLIGSEVVTLYTEFDVETAALDTAVETWAADPTAENRLAAQRAWHNAAAAWQRAEVTQFGPAGTMSAVAGGEDLRDRIYSWPLNNACRVDQELATQGYLADDFETARINVKGLDALEYLLFTEGAENDCSINSVINTDGSWDALTEETLNERRAAYAAVLTDELIVASDELLDWWSPDGKNFQKELKSAGAGSAIYATSQEALNAVSDALFYLEKETKDMKVAPPLGLTVCTESVCPELRESVHANASLEMIRQNLAGFAAVYRAGFAPLLRRKGATAVADELESKLQAAIDAFANIDATIPELLGADATPLVQAHDALREFVLLFRTQFLSVLDLELPQRAEGDND